MNGCFTKTTNRHRPELTGLAAVSRLYIQLSMEIRSNVLYGQEMFGLAASSPCGQPASTLVASHMCLPSTVCPCCCLMFLPSCPFSCPHVLSLALMSFLLPSCPYSCPHVCPCWQPHVLADSLSPCRHPHVLTVSLTSLLWPSCPIVLAVSLMFLTVTIHPLRHIF